jgi:hypothetical protein
MTSVPMEPVDLLAPIERLAARVPEGITTEDEIALAIEMLSDASEEVRAHGRPWTSVTVPPGIVTIVLKVAARGYMNPAGYRVEDADSAGLERDPSYSKGATLTPDEVRRVKAIASRSGFGYVAASKPSSWRPRSLEDRSGWTGYVPVDSANERLFPFIAEEEVHLYGLQAD